MCFTSQQSVGAWDQNLSHIYSTQKKNTWADLVWLDEAKNIQLLTSDAVKSGAQRKNKTCIWLTMCSHVAVILHIKIFAHKTYENEQEAQMISWFYRWEEINRWLFWESLKRKKILLGIIFNVFVII